MNGPANTADIIRAVNGGNVASTTVEVQSEFHLEAQRRAAVRNDGGMTIPATALPVGNDREGNE